MKRLTVHRPKGPYAYFRAVKLECDGVQVGEVRSGQTVDISVPDGAKELVGTIDWGRSAPLDLSTLVDGDVITIKGEFTLSQRRLMGLGRLPITLERTDP